MSLTPKYTVIETGRTVRKVYKSNMPVHESLILIAEMGQVVLASTQWTKESRWETRYYWCAAKTVGMSVTWVTGDPVGGKANPWVRKDSNPELDLATGAPFAHRDGVAHLMEIARHQPDAMGKPIFLGKPIPGLFFFPEAQTDSKGKVQHAVRTKYNTLDPLLHGPELSKMNVLEMTNDDLKAICDNMRPNSF